MGADKKQVEKTALKPRTSVLPLLLGSSLLLALLALCLPTAHEEINEIPRLTPQEEARLERRLKEIDDSEQYALVATVNGWYTCLHSGQTTCYLQSGEVWKYGVTSKGEFGRYTARFLIGNKVSYLVQFKGNYSDCLKQEQIRLFNYAYLPENLARPLAKRLPRPPSNPIMR